MQRDSPSTPQLHWRRTKIIATLGPASNTLKQIEALIEAGVNLVRLNMSHGDHTQHRKLVAHARKAASKHGQHTAIIMDLQGPKLRVGRFVEGGLSLSAGDSVTVTCRKVIGENSTIPSLYPNLHKDIQPGHRILLDDGQLELLSESVEGRDIRCRVVVGGWLSDNKGMNLPDTRVSAAALTAKDKEDVRLAVELGIDFLAYSYVRSAKEITALERFMKQLGTAIPIIAKIECPDAVHHASDIIQHSYGIMVARGDLGIELPPESVPLIQQDLIRMARRHHRPVIVATQMLESMIHKPRPTRAEVADVAHAATSSADAVMLSAETAAGQYPVEAVATMNRILREIEAHQWRQGVFGTPEKHHIGAHISVREAMAHAALTLVSDLKLEGIVIPTCTGTTARYIASERPTAPCIAVSADAAVCRKLSLHWGLISANIPEKEAHDWKRLCQAIAQQTTLTRPGHTILLISGFNDDPSLNEPVLKIMEA